MRKKSGFRWVRIPAAILLTAVLALQLQSRAQASEIRVRYTKAVNGKEALPVPEQELRDPDGTVWHLKRAGTEEQTEKGRTEKVGGAVLYEKAVPSAVFPEKAVLTVTDEESGLAFPAELPFRKAEFSEGRWEDDLSLTVTFHVYGADEYLLEGERIMPDADGRIPESCYGKILEAAGLNPEENRAEQSVWAGEAYINEAGETCRDAVLTGSRIVRSARAYYEGTVRFPDYKKYRLRLEYEREEKEERTLGTGETEAEKGEKKGEKKGFFRLSFRTVLTVSILAALLLLAGWHLLRKLAKHADEERRERK